MFLSKYCTVHILCNHYIWRLYHDIASVARLLSKKIHRVNKDLMIVWPKATARGRVQEGNVLETKNRYYE